MTNGETYSYTIILLLDDTVLIETTSDGDIVQDYLEGEGVARIWKQNTEDDFSYIEYTTGLQSDGTPFFAIIGRADLATDEEFNTPEAMTIDSWSEVRALFEEIAEDDLESVDEYFLQDNGNWVREDTADNG